MKVPLGVVGLPNIQIKHSFWLYVITLFLALLPTIVLRELVTNLVEAVANQALAALVMYFLGYIISFSVFIVIYEGLKTGKFKLNFDRIWCMFMAWLKSMTIILPAALMFAIIIIAGLVVFFINGSVGMILIGTSIVGIILLIPLNILLQWYYYEKGV